MKPTSPLFLFLGFSAYCAAAPLGQGQTEETATPDATFITRAATPRSTNQRPDTNPNPRRLRHHAKMPQLNGPLGGMSATQSFSIWLPFPGDLARPLPYSLSVSPPLSQTISLCRFSSRRRWRLMNIRKLRRTHYLLKAM
jgi:hypothetical protein